MYYYVIHSYRSNTMYYINMNQEMQNSFESKCSMKIETNSRGFNTTVHVYQGAKKAEVDETVKMVIYAHNELQKHLAPVAEISK